MRSKFGKRSPEGVLGEVRSRVRKKLLPKSLNNWPKALEMEARGSQKPFRRGSQKSVQNMFDFVSLLRVKRETKMESKSLKMELLESPGAQGVPERVRVASGTQFWTIFDNVLI